MKFDLNPYNKRQKEAITHTDGPLLVISGAGTGKTHVLTGRILNLILGGDVPVDRILALTFTEKATREMADRVETALPLGYGETCIKTFHAFCESVLRERGHEIGLSTDFKLLNEVDLWMFLKNHVLDFDLKYYRALTNPHKFLNKMQGYFSRLQDEDITPEQYLAYATAGVKNALSDEEKENTEKQMELARTYGKYLQLLVENEYMDFGSLIFYTLRLLERRKSVLAEFRNRFRYILVDEFQDTNFAQNKLVMMLAREHQNLFVVGDDDQSIYKWRGASLTNIQHFQREFPRAKKIVLNENYRSTQQILDAAYSSIQNNNPNRLEMTQKVDKALHAVAKKGKTAPEIHHFTSVDEEVNFVISKATSALLRGENTAILVRTNALAIPFLNKLKGGKLPFQHFSQTTLFTKPGVKDCMALLRVLADPRDDLAMFRFLSLPFLNVPMKEILKAAKEAKYANRPIMEMLDGKKFITIKESLSKLVEFSRDHTVSEVIRRFLKESTYLRHAAEKNKEITDDIMAFSERVADFEERNENKQVTDFLTYAQLLEEIGRYQLEDPALDPNSIKILTIHGAKGLEFDSVFVPGLVKNKFPGISRRDAFEIPQELIPEQIPEGNHHIEEERRLFYVACTRARENLTLTYSDFYDSVKQWKSSPFIYEILSEGKAIRKTSKKKRPSAKQQGELPLGSRSHRTIKLALPKLSYSQIDTFQTCPLKYQFRYLFNISTPLPSVVNFGSSVHNALKDFYSGLKATPGGTKMSAVNLLQIFKKCYEKNWIPFGYETRELQEHQKEQGMMMLERFLEHEKKNFVIPTFIEKSFSLELGNLALNGRIDRIDRLPDGTYEVIDYKTGSNKEKNLKNDLQLSIYALACRDVLKIPVSRLSLYYVEGPEKVSTTRTDAQIEACKEDIISVAKEISASEFTPTPGFQCGYCDYKLICPAAIAVAQ